MTIIFDDDYLFKEVVMIIIYPKMLWVYSTVRSNNNNNQKFTYTCEY